LSKTRRILPARALAVRNRDATEVCTLIEKKALPLKVPETKVTTSFGEADANIEMAAMLAETLKNDTNEGNKEMRKQKGFSLIELLIVVAIILIIAAIAIPNLLRARMAANESSAVASIRTINTAEVTYNSTYPTVGFSANLVSLGGALGAACVPASTTACLIDSVLANNGNPAGGGKSGYSFTTGAGTVAGGVNVGYVIQGTPITINQTGIRGFCAEEDSVVRVDAAGKCSLTEAGVLTFNPLNQ
jgi:type IV pilus assembly protein PilA